MRQLTLLANKYGTDKGTVFREQHGYTEIYEDFLKQYIGKHPRILEIGVENGDSLKMWNDFFVGDCEIYAIDIEPEKIKYQTNNTHIFIFDQSSRIDWEAFKSKLENNGENFFDIIIEDGSHMPEHQIITLYELSNSVKKDNGIYILEDLHTNIEKKWYFLNGIEMSDTPLFSLIFFEKSKFLTDEENEYLYSKIKNINIYSLDNEFSQFKNRSITGIINFK